MLALDGIIDITGQTELCFRLLSPALEAELYVVWKKYQVHSRASRAFLEQLLGEINGEG